MLKVMVVSVLGQKLGFLTLTSLSSFLGFLNFLQSFSMIKAIYYHDLTYLSINKYESCLLA